MPDKQKRIADLEFENQLLTVRAKSFEDQLKLARTLIDRLGHMPTTDSGRRYYSRTSRPKIIEYREGHPNWKKTMHSGKIRGEGSKKKLAERGWELASDTRVCESYEYKKGPNA